MRTTTGCFVVGMLVIGTGAFRTTSPTTRMMRAPACGLDETWRDGVVEYVTDLVTSADSERMAVRDSMKLVPTTAAEVQAVAVDSMCRLAGRTINTADTVSIDTPRRIYLVKAGPRYWAEDPNMTVDGHQLAFVLDTTLTIVVGRVMN